MNVFEARNAAFDLALEDYDPKKVVFSKYNSIYIASTSNVKGTMALYDNSGDVLTVEGTGAHGFEALLNGARRVLCFDVNELQRLYFLFMQTAIINLDYEEFIKHFTLKKHGHRYSNEELKDLLSNKLFDKLVYHLPREVIEVFGPVYDFNDSLEIIHSSLFRSDKTLSLEYLKKYVSFYNEEEYYKLQKILRERNPIDYRTINLLDLPKEVEDKYNLIVLDNILQYYKNIHGLDTPYAVNMFISKELSKLLDDDGKIQVNYGYELACDAFREKFKIPYQKNGLKITLAAKRLIDEEKKNGVNIPLVQKWDNYSYDIISGVESEAGLDSDNLVLTYQKIKKNR